MTRDTKMDIQNTRDTTNTIIASGMIETRLGVIMYTHEDIFCFHDGLTGFPNKKKFALVDVPNIPADQRYGLLQSLEDDDLCFILSYPVLNNQQQEQVLNTVQNINNNKFITKDEVSLAFLVIVNNDSNNTPHISLVTDAPLLFLNATKEGWQMINENYL